MYRPRPTAASVANPSCALKLTNLSLNSFPFRPHKCVLRLLRFDGQRIEATSNHIFPLPDTETSKLQEVTEQLQKHRLGTKLIKGSTKSRSEQTAGLPFWPRCCSACWVARP